MTVDSLYRSVLNGRVIHADDDLDVLLREAERLESEGLYTLRLVGLVGPVA